MITTSAKSAVSSIIFDFITRLDLVKAGTRGIRQFFVEQSGPDRFQLSVVKDEPFDPRSVETFISKMKISLGAQIEVEVAFVNEIANQPNGKRRWFKKSFEERS